VILYDRRWKALEKDPVVRFSSRAIGPLCGPVAQLVERGAYTF